MKNFIRLKYVYLFLTGLSIIVLHPNQVYSKHMTSILQQQYDYSYKPIQIPVQNFIKSNTNTITGCDFLCGGNIDYTYGYTLEYTNPTTIYKWEVIPAMAANIIEGQGSSSISVTYHNTINSEVVIKVTPENDLNTELPIYLNVHVDQNCMWPGDINNNGQVSWIEDMITYSYGTSFYNTYQTIHPNHEPIIREIPCSATNILHKYTWAPHPKKSWNLVTPSNYEENIDMSFLDANGDGNLNYANTVNYNGQSILPTNPTDPDIIMHYAYQAVPLHQGNNLVNKEEDINTALHVEMNDSLLASGGRLKVKVSLGEPTNPLPHVHSIAFILSFETGIHAEPIFRLANSHLGDSLNLNHAQYPAMNSETRREWYISMGRETLSGKDFYGEEICRTECIITIGHVKDEITFMPIKARIIEAGITDANGSFQRIGGDSTTVFVTSAETPPTKVIAKGFLGGCFYNETTGLSNNQLRQANLIPAQHPYATAPWDYTGIEQATDTTEIPKNAVDWVLLEVRDATTNAVVEQRAAYLLTDGTIADPLNHGKTAEVNFFRLQDGNNYHLILRHRNHLDVMSAVPITVINNQLNYDFSVSMNAALGNHQLKEIAPNVFALKAGDCNGDGVINVQDFNDYQNQVSQTNGYFGSDFTMDGNVLVDDFNGYEEHSSAIGVSVVRY